MSRKMSAYSRKRAGKPQLREATFLTVIQRCRPYTEEHVPGDWFPGTQEIADEARNRVNKALGRMVRGAWEPEETEGFDLIAQAIGLTVIRCLEIAGEGASELIRTHKATAALNAIKDRRDRLGKWGATRQEQIDIAAALEVYEAVLQASSPAQMAHAAEQRKRVLAKQAATIGKPVTA